MNEDAYAYGKELNFRHEGQHDSRQSNCYSMMYFLRTGSIETPIPIKFDMAELPCFSLFFQTS